MADYSLLKTGRTAKLPGDLKLPPLKARKQIFDKAAEFGWLWAALTHAGYGYEQPVAEYRFHPTRRWRFDWAFLGARLAVEIDGGHWVRGRNSHHSPTGGSRDREKDRAAIMLGWRVLRYTTGDLKQRPVQIIEEVKRFLRKE